MTDPPPRLTRVTAILFCPATRPDRVVKLPATGADVGIVDLEDAVAPSDKEDARSACRQAVLALSESDPSFPVVVRVNKPGSYWFEADVESLAGLPLAGVALPKVETPSDVRLLRTLLGPVDQEQAAVIAGIETARGVTGIERILADAAPTAVYFGAEDLAADIGASRTDAGLEVLYARSHVALHARAAGILCADQVFVRLDDDEQFERDARFGKSLGYHGKMCLHPRQVPLAHRAFLPTAEEASAARRILAAYESAAPGASGGVIRLDGEMVDEPMVRRARQVVASIEDAVDPGQGGGGE